jgi:putative transposase
MHSATKIRIYPTKTQQEALSKAFGCARWYWNNSLSETQKTYAETGKGLGQFALNARLPALKKEFVWLAETHSQVLQSVSLHMSRAFVNFFERRAKYPRFKSKHDKQSIQYPQGVKLVEGSKVFLPKIGHVKATIHRKIEGRIKTVTITKEPSGRYFAAILSDTEQTMPAASFEGKIIGLDVGLTHLAVTSDGSKYENPRHIARAAKNLVRKQRTLSRKTKGSASRSKARIIVAKCHEKVANARRDWLHKLSSKLVHENQVIAIEDLSVKNMMQNRNLSKAIGDAGWGMLSVFIEYKTAQAGKGFIKVNRFFPSSKTCSCCLHAQKEMPLNIRTWRCDACGTQHDRDVNAAKNIRAEALRMIAAGTDATANGGSVSQKRGRKSSILLEPLKLEASPFRAA